MQEETRSAAKVATSREGRVKKALVVVVAVVAGMVPAGAGASGTSPSCDEPLSSVVVDQVAVAGCDSNALGGDTVFSYYLPGTCTVERRCPVLYLLHGFGGDHTSMLGTAASPSSFVRGLRRDPVSGADLPDIDFILIAPDGRTVDAGAGAPPKGQESFWVDWNPRRWANPPRFEAFVTDELVSLADRSFPSIATREGRAIDGISLGGFGSFKLALQHPDLYANAGSISGALNILVAPGPQPVRPPAPAGLGEDLPNVHGPSVARTPPGFPFGDPFGAFGDPVSDEAYFRGNNPLDLALNADGLNLRYFHNDTITRAPAEDIANPASFFGAQALEAVVMPMNLEMVSALSYHGTPFEHEIHPGLHSGRYWDPYIRHQLEWHAARVSHDGAPLPSSAPKSFDHRSIREDFEVWDWSVQVEDREAQEFTTLWGAGPDGVVLQGSGTITLQTPPMGITCVSIQGGFGGYGQVTLGDGSAKIVIDMGSSANVADEHAGTSVLPSVAIRFNEPPCGPSA